MFFASFVTTMQIFYGVIETLQTVRANKESLWGFWHTKLCGKLGEMRIMREYQEFMDRILEFHDDETRIDELYHCLERFGESVNEVKSLAEFQRMRSILLIERVGLEVKIENRSISPIGL